MSGLFGLSFSKIVPIYTAEVGARKMEFALVTEHKMVVSNEFQTDQSFIFKSSF